MKTKTQIITKTGGTINWTNEETLEISYEKVETILSAAINHSTKMVVIPAPGKKVWIPLEHIASIWVEETNDA
ncbi:MAG: hypothetical protein Q8P05_02825 [Candidatus Diapherotrites archaeon]|nr:hypothetical protein [Candidatus Diapherotrites archaeon]